MAYQTFYNPYQYQMFTNNQAQTPLQQIPQSMPVQMPQQPQPMSSGIIWVQGKSAAQAYPVPAGQTILLMDSDSPTLYLKTTDVSGRPAPMVVYDLVERKEDVAATDTPKPEPVDLSEYVKRSEIEDLIEQKMSEIKFTTTTAPAISNKHGYRGNKGGDQ